VNKPKSLRDLVEAAITRHDTSGRQLAFLAQREGFTLATTTVNAIRQGTYKSAPSKETIKAIAWLAGVSDEVAFTAAGQPVPGPPFAEELPPGVDNLPPKARKAAIDMLRVLVDLNKDADEAEQAERLAARDERRRRLQEAGYVSPGQKTEGVPDHVPVGMGSTAVRVSIVITELRKRYGLENGRLPEDWRESIIESGLWEDAAAPFLTGQLGQYVVKEQFLNRLIDDLEKADATDSTGAVAAKRRAGKAIQERRVRDLQAADYPDNNIPLPKDYLELAAHPDTESSGRREHEAGRERGEESQDTSN
jgi:hypothetical protein